MTITFNDFKNQKTSIKRFLVIFDVVENGNVSNKKTLFLTNLSVRGFSRNYYDLVKSIPIMSHSCQEVFKGKSVISSGQVVFVRTQNRYMNEDKSVFTDDLITGKYLAKGQDIKILFGGDYQENVLPENLYKQILYGKIKSVKNISKESFALEYLDYQSVLSKIIINPNIIAAGTYVPESVVGKYKPLVFGEAKNISPILINSNNYTYLFHDTAVLPFQSLDAVYDKGNLLTPGSGYTNNNDGTFTLALAPIGNVTCNVKGCKFGPPTPIYKQKIGEIIYGVLTQIAGYSSNLIESMTTFNYDIPYPVNLYIQEKTDILNLFDQLTEGLPILYSFDATGYFYIKEFKTPENQTAILTITQDNIENFTIEQDADVLYSQSINYDKNHTVLSESQIGSVALDFKTWLSNQYRKETYANSTIQSSFPMSETGKDYISCLNLRTDAQLVVQKWVSLKGKIRFKISFDYSPLLLDLRLGDIVTIKHSFFGNDFLTGKKMGVIGFAEDFSKNKTNVILWG